MTAADILDLRSALEFLASIPGQLATMRQPVDAHAELAAVYRRAGAGPALLFENVKGAEFCGACKKPIFSNGYW